MSKRPLASISFAIGKWNSLYNMLSLLLSFHNGLFLAIRTNVIEKIFGRDTTKKDYLYNLYVFAIFAHATILLNALLSILVNPMPDWITKVKNDEKILEE
jgi:hypothetical protein